MIAVNVSMMGQVDSARLDLRNYVLQRGGYRGGWNAIQPRRGKIQEKHALCPQSLVCRGRLPPHILNEFGREDVGSSSAHDHYVRVIAFGYVAGDRPAAAQHLVVGMRSDNQNAAHAFLSEHV